MLPLILRFLEMEPNWLPESATDDPFSLTHHLAV